MCMEELWGDGVREAGVNPAATTLRGLLLSTVRKASHELGWRILLI